MKSHKSETDECKSGRGVKLFSFLLVAVLLIISFACAWELPVLYSYYQDKINLGGEAYQTMEVEAYSYDYATMEEKIEELAFFQNNGIDMAKIQIPDGATEEPSSDELRRLLQHELDEMTALEFLPSAINLEDYKLSDWGEYRLYPVSSEQFKGEISYWSIVFYGKNTTIIACMDTEFHMLYSLDIAGELAWESVQLLAENYMLDEIVKPEEGEIFEKLKLASEKFSANEVVYYNLTCGSEMSCEEVMVYDNYAELEAAVEEYYESDKQQTEQKNRMYEETYKAQLYAITSDIVEAIKYGTDVESQIHIPGYINMESDVVLPVYMDMNMDNLRISLGCF